MTPTLADIGEDGMLKRFAAFLPAGGSLRVGPGDDCAVVRVEDTAHDLLLKTDCVVEGVHFEPSTPPEKVGRKALARALSDIAAMGGQADHALVTLVLPAATAVAWVDAFYAGLDALATTTGTRVAGGELARMPAAGPAVASIALAGRVPAGRAVLRSGGRAGDVLAVTGWLGGSLASGHHLDFEPRLAQGQLLAHTGLVHAMMDLSDGLARDLPRLARRSGCGFTVDEPALPCRAGFTTANALGDGEDYELLLAVAPGDWDRLAAAWRVAFPALPLVRIGRLTAVGAGHALPPSGWDHFAGAQASQRP